MERATLTIGIWITFVVALATTSGAITMLWIGLADREGRSLDDVATVLLMAAASIAANKVLRLMRAAR